MGGRSNGAHRALICSQSRALICSKSSLQSRCARPIVPPSNRFRLGTRAGYGKARGCRPRVKGGAGREEKGEGVSAASRGDAGRVWKGEGVSAAGEGDAGRVWKGEGVSAASGREVRWWHEQGCHGACFHVVDGFQPGKSNIVVGRSPQ